MQALWKDEGRGTAVLRAAIAIAKALSLKVVAEGVETPEQHRRLLDEGCDLFQGYLFARPMPFDSFMTYLEDSRAPSGADGGASWNLHQNVMEISRSLPRLADAKS